MKQPIHCILKMLLRLLVLWTVDTVAMWITIGLRGQTQNRAGIAVGVIQKQWSFPLLRMTKCTGSYGA